MQTDRHSPTFKARTRASLKPDQSETGRPLETTGMRTP